MSIICINPKRAESLFAGLLKTQDGVNIQKEYYVKKQICVVLLKIDNFKKKCSIYHHWNNFNHCGTCIHYDINIPQTHVIDYLKDFL